MTRGSFAASEPGLRSEASAIEPMPVEARPRNDRRVISRAYFSKISMRSLSRDGFVEVQDRAGHGGPGGQLRRGDLLGSGRLADPERLLRRFRIRLVLLEVFGVEREEHL